MTKGSKNNYLSPGSGLSLCTELENYTAVQPETECAPAITKSTPTLSGVQSSSSGVQTTICKERNVSSTPVLNIPTDEQLNSDKLPDLVRLHALEIENYSNVLDTVPPVGDQPPDNIFNGGTTKEEFDVVDALLSLSTARDAAIENALDENFLLMPVGGDTLYKDVNPVSVHLDQVTIDRAIAQIVEKEGISEALHSTPMKYQAYILPVVK